jgi:hypothetical protein
MESVGLTQRRMPCMTVVSLEVYETGILQCCLPHEEDVNAGPSSSMTDHRITLPESLPRSFPIRRPTTADVGSACPFMHIDGKIPHTGETRSH